METIKTLIADDHEILRYGISTYLANAEEIELVGEASTGEECIELFRNEDPDLCILDIDMPEKNGIEVARAIREIDQEVKILILSMHIDEQILSDILQAGIDGYLLKNTEKSELLQGIRSILNGQKVFSEKITQMMAETFISNGSRSSLPPDVNLTKREHEILRLIVEGYTSQEIADQLYISPRTVETHRANMMNKLEIRNTAGLVRFAIQNNLLSET